MSALPFRRSRSWWCISWVCNSTIMGMLPSCRLLTMITTTHSSNAKMTIYGGGEEKFEHVYRHAFPKILPQQAMTRVLHKRETLLLCESFPPLPMATRKRFSTTASVCLARGAVHDGSCLASRYGRGEVVLFLGRQRECS